MYGKIENLYMNTLIYLYLYNDRDKYLSYHTMASVCGFGGGGGG